MLNKPFRAFRYLRLLRLIDCKSFFYLSIAKLCNITLPFRYYAPRLGQSYTETLFTPETNNPRQLIELRRSIRRVARHLPWHTKCLDQAMATHWILSRRGFASTLYFGVRKSEETKDLLDAHAWVRCGDVYVIGYQPLSQFTVVGSYAKLGGGLSVKV
jgi:hypothetical protein